MPDASTVAESSPQRILALYDQVAREFRGSKLVFKLLLAVGTLGPLVVKPKLGLNVAIPLSSLAPIAYHVAILISFKFIWGVERHEAPMFEDAVRRSLKASRIAGVLLWFSLPCVILNVSTFWRPLGKPIPYPEFIYRFVGETSPAQVAFDTAARELLARRVLTDDGCVALVGQSAKWRSPNSDETDRLGSCDVGKGGPDAYGRVRCHLKGYGATSCREHEKNGTVDFDCSVHGARLTATIVPDGSVDVWFPE